MERVIDEAVLAPIPGLHPAGEDIRGLNLWVDITKARPKPDGLPPDRGWQQANQIRTDWPTYRDILEKALRDVSKDLELATFLTEASTRVFGFQGARDALWIIGGLITNFREQGLHPLPEDGDLELQYAKLEWLNEKFSEVLSEIPLTWQPEPGENYSLNYYRESRRVGGMITAAEFDAAAAAGENEEYASILNIIKETREELAHFKQTVSEAYGNGVLSFTFTDDALNECDAVVQGILHKREPNGPPAEPPNPPPGPPGNPSPTPRSDDAWSQAEQLARNDVPGALARMTALAAAEPNGRIRFQRKLLLADLCIKTNRKKLATSILQELNEIIETHKLEQWETSEIVGGVWARLVRCYRDKAAGTANEELETQFFRKLSRLDPWQALTCGEPVKKD